MTPDSTPPAGPEAASPQVSATAEANHRIANSLSIAAAMLRMQAKRVEDEAARAALLEAESRLSAIAAVHAHIQPGSPDGRVDLGAHLCEVLHDIGRSIGAELVLEVQGGGAVEVAPRVARDLTIAINELALNSVKHGYGYHSGGRISLVVERLGEDGLRVDIRDGGTGMPDGFDPAGADGLGMRLVSSLVADLGGTLDGRNDGGACFTIELPSGRRP